MDDGTPALEVGFLIDTGSSYDALIQLQRVMESTEAQVLREATAIERATSGMVNVGGATAEIRSFGSAATKEYQAIARERNQAEKSGEGMVRSLEREAAAFGKSRSEIRLMKVETAALAAEKAGLTELATRLRTTEAAINAKEYAAIRAARYEAEAAAEDMQMAADKAAAAAQREAQALREAAFAHQMFEAAARRGVAAMREREAVDRAGAAAQADIAARAQRLIESVNPAAAAQNRFNVEMAEARTLISAGAISLDDYADKLRMERAALTASSAAHARGAVSAGEHRQAMIGVSYQVQDFITQVSMGANPINAFAVQGAQLAGQFANVEGRAGTVARFFMGPWGLAITGAAMVLGMLTKDLFETGDASDKLKLRLDVQKNSYDVLIKSVREYNETQQDSAALTRQATEEAKKQSLELIKLAKAQLAAAEAKYFDQGTTGKAADVKASLGYQVGVAEQRLVALRRELSEIEKGLANQAVEASMKKEVEISTRYGKLLNQNTLEYDKGSKSVAAYRTERERLLRLQEKELEVYRAAKRETDKAGPGAGAIATRDARVGDMVALIKSLFPGAAITSTTGGQHTKGSDHYSGRAIDFVPGGGMGKYTTAEVEQILKDAGVDIRRNARGTQQLFGPGRGASKPGDHDDHFHVAWQGSPDTSKVEAQKAAALAEVKRAYDATVKAAEGYAATQFDEAAKTGLSAKELRLYADAAAMAKAPTDALKLAIAAGAAAREKAFSGQSAKDFQANVLQPLRDELALYGLTGPARAMAALDLEKQSFLAKNMGDGVAVATARWQEYYAIKKDLIEKDAAADREVERIQRLREEFDRMTDAAREAGNAIAGAFGRVGGAVADAIDIITEYGARQREIDDLAAQGKIKAAVAQSRSAKLQLEGLTALTGAAKGMFREHSTGYKAMAAAEKAFALVQLANTAVNVAAGAAKMFSSLGPLAFPAVAAMIGVMASLGFGGGGKSSYKPAETNTGTGTILGDSGAQSESIRNALAALNDVNALELGFSRQMAASLRSIDSQIGNVASLIVRAGDLNASAGVTEGFKTDALGKALSFGAFGPIGEVLKKIPVIGGIINGIQGVIKGLFGTKTTVLASGLYGGAQSIGDILGGGFDASYYSDVQKKKKFLGLTTSNKTSTSFTGADPMLENQFTLILRSFNDAIVAAAGPLGAATGEIQQRLSGFTLSLGKIDLKGLTGEQIEEKLNAVFGAAADNMASAAFPFITQFQKVGEGAFETLVRVSSTIEAVGASLDMLGQSAQGMGIAAKLGLADQFESVSALTSAVDAYFQQFYTKEEQAAARTAQMASVFQSLGLAMPSTLAGFRQLVEAQNLNTAAGQANYATLLKLAPAFADLQAAMEGAKSAADIASERADLQRQLLELNGDTAALRALQLAKLDASNRELQQQIWAIQDANAASKAADELRKAWQSVGDSIMDEVRRIRGLTDAGGGNGFASLMGQFNAANAAARGGDMDAAKSLPQLSQALLAAAADAATSRQELDRVRAQIAAALEATHGGLPGNPAASNAALLAAGAANQPAATSSANDNGAGALGAKIEALTAEVAQLRAENNSGHAATAANTGSMKRTLDNVTSDSGGNAVTVEIAAAAA